MPNLLIFADMRSSTKLGNTGGIIGISKDRKERMHAISSIIAEGNFDFVFLQEIWSLKDYHLIKRNVAEVLPYSQYFHSGVLGSGCCIFSQGTIVDTSFVKYNLNGYFYKLQHGDWYGGKGVGYCKVIYNGLTINLYNTHLHAEYSRDNDIYLAHRVTQAWQLSQFVNQTAGNADLSIIAGDFNATPEDISYKIIRQNSNLYDSYEERENKNILIEHKGATSGHPRNYYTGKVALKDLPDGQRIDHIFYTFPNGTNVRCLEFLTPYDKVPQKQFSYSDHEAVISRLMVKKSHEALAYESDQNVRVDTLRNSKFIIQTAMQHLRFNKFFYLLLAIMTTILIIVSSAIYVPYPLSIILIPLRIVLTLILVFAIYMASLWNAMEYRPLALTMTGMDTVVSNIALYTSIK